MANKKHILGWNEEHPQHEVIDSLWNELVPGEGEAETVEGEVIRACGRLVYEWCNNGNCNAVNQTSELCDSCGGDGFQDGAWDEDAGEYEQVDCSWCGGECYVDGELEMSEYYDLLLSHIEYHVPNIHKEVQAVKELILGDKNYNYNYDESETEIYNAMTEKAVAWVVEQRKK